MLGFDLKPEPELCQRAAESPMLVDQQAEADHGDDQHDPANGHLHGERENSGNTADHKEDETRQRIAVVERAQVVDASGEALRGLRGGRAALVDDRLDLNRMKSLK